MTIEDRVRRVLTEAVADEPPLRGVPLETVRRRRRRRPVLAGAVAVVLVLAAAAGLVAVRRQDRVLPAAPTLTTLPTTGWPEVTDEAGNLSFRHPPGWEARKSRGMWSLAPPEAPGGRGRPEYRVTIAPGGYWRYDGAARASSSPQIGRLPGGQAYRFKVGDSPERGSYVVDWGRVCRAAAAPGSCQPRSVHVGYFPTGDRRYGDRFRPEVETVVGSLRPLRPTAPTGGDPSRPACRADQWALVHPRAWGATTDNRRWIIPAGVGFLGGRPCHLRAPVRLAIQQDGRLLPIGGNPAPATIQLDLPEDALPDDFVGMGDERMLLRWAWDEMCDRELGITDRTEMVFSDERGRRLLTLGIELTGFTSENCTDRSRRSVLAAWP
jgi:hypothetical protein